MGNDSFSIIRAVNFKLKDPEYDEKRIKRALLYILNPKSTNPELMFHQMVDPNDVLGTFGAFASAFGKERGRKAKHYIVSFGKTGSEGKDWSKYYTASKAIVKFFGGEQQMIFAVHSDIPSRPHMHMLLDVVNVKTGKKFQQSTKDLELLKDHVDGALDSYNLPLLRRKRGKSSSLTGNWHGDDWSIQYENNDIYEVGDECDYWTDDGDYNYSQLGHNPTVLPMSNLVELGTSEAARTFFRPVRTDIGNGERIKFDFKKLKGGI